MNSLIVYTNNRSIPLLAFKISQGIKPIFDRYLPSLSILYNEKTPSIAISPNGKKLVAGYNYSSTSENSNKYFVIKDLANAKTSQPLIGFDGYIKGVACTDKHYLLFGSLPFLRLYDWQDRFINLDTSGLGEVVHTAFNSAGDKLFVLHQNSPYMRVYDIAKGQYTDRQQTNNPYTNLIFYIDNKLWYIDRSQYKVFGLDDDLQVVTQSLQEKYDFFNNEYAHIIKHPTKQNTLLINNSSSIIEYNIISQNTNGVITGLDSVSNFSVIDQHLYIYTNSYYVKKIQVYGLDYQLDDEKSQQFKFLAGNDVQFVHAKFDTATITGIVRDIDNKVAQRKVRAYNRQTGELVAQTQSNTQGEYTLELPNTSRVDVQFMAQDGELLNDLFYANVEPKPV